MHEASDAHLPRFMPIIDRDNTQIGMKKSCNMRRSLLLQLTGPCPRC
jgi:hypothetical protein